VIREKLAARIIQGVVKSKSRSSFKLSPAQLDNYPEPERGKKYLLYLHVPFCNTFCSYCTFYRVKFNEIAVNKYFKSLRIDIKRAHDKGYDFQGVYIGGGTPTLAPDQVAETIDLLRSLYDIKEVSCEANPNIDDHILNTLKNRVDRLSIGVQSFQNSLLNKSKRLEKYGEPHAIREKITKAIEAFHIVNVDMIFNFFNQTEEALLKDLNIIRDLSPHQIAYYPLMNSKYTTISKEYGGYSQKNELAFYKLIMQYLNQDYDQVGSWSFTKKGGKFFDEYVVNHDEYLGLGAGAFSYIDNILYANTFNLDQYNQAIENNQSTIELKNNYGLIDQLKYRFMLKLFSNEFEPETFDKQYGQGSTKMLSKELAFLKLINSFNGNRHSMTEQGKYYALIMMKEFYIGMNELRAKLQ
jgi:coproporphyrinogen III oxidase-like Fe-S oxidoreductase